MASYSELFGIASNADLRNKIAAAIAHKADQIRSEADTVPNNANRRLWAKEAFANPEAMAARMIWAILAANQAQTVNNILGATDAAILTAVGNAVDVFATGPSA
jgi:hypothetical protein